jgi:hypothetical protein
MRKAAVTTLAAALVAGSLSGLPLSSQGWQAKLGLSSTVYAADSAVPSEFGAIKTKLQEVQAHLLPEEVAVVTGARNSAAALAYDPSLVDDVWATLSTHDLSGTSITQQSLFEAAKAIALIAYGDLAQLDRFGSGGDLNRLIRDLGQLAGVSLTFNDFFDFATALEDKVVDSGEILLVGSRAELRELVRQKTIELLADTSYKVSEVFKKLGVRGSDILEMKDKFAGFIPNYNEANLTMMLGAVRSDLEFQSETNGNSGVLTPILRSKTYQLNIPDAFLRWEVQGDNLRVIGDGKKITVAPGAGPGIYTGTVTAKVNYPGWLNGKLLYEGPIELHYQIPPGPPIVPPGQGIPPWDTVTPPNYGSIISDLTDQLGGYRDRLKEATGEERKQILEEIQRMVAETVSKLSVLKINNSTVNDEGRIVIRVDDNSLTQQIREIKQAYEQMKSNIDQLGESVEIPPLMLTLDVGTIQDAGVDVELSQTVLNEAIANGMNAIRILVNELSVTLPIEQFGGDTVFSVTQSDESLLEQGINKTLASAVYQFGITVNGQTVEEFDSPIELRIPLADAAGLDQELLALARIDGDELVIVGHRLEGNFLVAKRDSFSYYAVIENKVTFNDLDKVRSWAGRQIEVIGAKGIVQGKREGYYYPQDKVTRAEFAKMLVRALELENRKAKAGFIDVKQDSWAAPFVAAAAEAGIIQGVGGNRFQPDAAITRAEMATMIARALKLTGGLQDPADIDQILSAFNDSGSIHPTLREGVALAANEGIVVGFNGKFRPNDNATRAEAAVMIYRLLQ